jgi:hypothetical protein
MRFRACWLGAAFSSCAALIGCVSEPRVSLGVDLQGALDDGGVRDASQVYDDDDAAPGSRTDDGDDIINAAECAEKEMVCGTDHKDYRNRCDAQDAGVSVAKEGPCTP